MFVEEPLATRNDKTGMSAAIASSIIESIYIKRS